MPKAYTKERHRRDTQTIDAAWAMVESLKGWGQKEWNDPEIQAAAMAGAKLFIEAMKDRLPTELK